MIDVKYEYGCEITSTSECPLRKEIRADAIDEFVNKCKKRIEEIVMKIEDDIPFLDMIDIQKIAEQLKEQTK